KRVIVISASVSSGLMTQAQHFAKRTSIVLFWTPARGTPRLQPEGQCRGTVGSLGPASSVWLFTKPFPPGNPSPWLPATSNRCSVRLGDIVDTALCIPRYVMPLHDPLVTEL